MKRKILISLLFASSFILIACSKNIDNKDKQKQGTNNAVTSTDNKTKKEDLSKVLQKQFDAPTNGDSIAIIHVKKYGDIKLKFFDKVAPKAVENFITHSKNGYYSGVTFHRIIKDFVIQGGDPTGSGSGGNSIWGKDFEDEFPKPKTPMPFPYNGALAMANIGRKDTNGSQFFIVNSPPIEDVITQMQQNSYPKEIIELYKIHGGSPHLFYKHTVFGQVFQGMDVVSKIMDDSANSASNPVVIDNIEILKYEGK